jgi:SAM-dependent methyltransferase
MAAQKNYWQERSVRSGGRIGSMLKRAVATRALMNLLFSVRTADEVFLAKALSSRGVTSVLDVACGAGKTLLPAVARYVAGVDIRGYPAQQALAKGYGECVEYDPPGYDFEIAKPVDAATIINLNAHISQESYAAILQRTIRFVRRGGFIILVNEYDNDGLSYRWMRRRPGKFQRFVSGMEHWHLGYEADFLAFVGNRFPGLRLVERRPLAASILPSLHYYAYLTERDPGPVARMALVLFDIPLSIANNVQRSLAEAFNRSFLVGYVFELAG